MPIASRPVSSLTTTGRRWIPHRDECLATAGLLRAALDWPQERLVVSFQSRFGRDPWIQPATDATLLRLAGEGAGRVDVVCPGFAADCLETLEEIAITNGERFLAAGGGELRYPALFMKVLRGGWGGSSGW